MTDQRISRDLALEHIRHHLQAHAAQTQTVPVTEALALVCARDLFAAHASPVAAKSYVDGYALDSQATRGASPESPACFEIAGEIRPSSSPAEPLPPGQAVVMLTGGPMPPGADCAVAMEDVEVQDGRLVLTRELQPGLHVCQAGCDIKAGSRIVRRGQDFTPAVLATLAVSGILQVEAYSTPRTSVLAIGNELAPLDCQDHDGQDHDGQDAGGRMPADNLLLAAGLLRLRGVDQVRGEVCANGLEHIAERLRGLAECDCIVTTGGTGPGQRDFILRAAVLAGFTPLFNGVALTPGKSFFAAVRGRTMLFALPGTPWCCLPCAGCAGAPCPCPAPCWRGPWSCPPWLSPAGKNWCPAPSSPTDQSCAPTRCWTEAARRAGT